MSLLRLPEKYQTRLIFAALTQIVGSLVALLTVLVFAFAGWELVLFSIGVSLLYSLGAFPAAYILWPKTKQRTRFRMAFIGAFTVALAFTISAMIFSIIEIILNLGEFRLDKLVNIPVSIAATVFFGSLITLGLPYLVGAFFSQLFVEDR